MRRFVEEGARVVFSDLLNEKGKALEVRSRLPLDWNIRRKQSPVGFSWSAIFKGLQARRKKRAVNRSTQSAPGDKWRGPSSP